MYKILQKINLFLFLILLLTLGITFFTRNNYKNVETIVSEVLKEPLQKDLNNPGIIKFTKDNFSYELKPLYDYEINGLVVHKMDYRWFSLSKTDNAIPMDLGIIWGSNIKNRVYQDKSLKFSQDSRFLWAKWSGNLTFNFGECSNNHLVVNNSDLEKKLKNIYTGDQVKIRGKLVNIKATYQGKGEKNELKNMELATSTARDDMGAGACEIIYVEDIIVLQKANVFSRFLFTVSLYGVILMTFFNIINFFKSVTAVKQ